MIYLVLFEIWNENSESYSYKPIAAYTNSDDADRHADNLNEMFANDGFDSYYVEAVPLNP